MHYYIDGYNLMFRVLHAGEDLQVQRQKIIEDLYIKIHFLELNATLVFDSQYHHGETSLSYKHHLKILFTALGQTADDLILDEIKHAVKPMENIVVTSDKKLAWLARRRSAKTETVEEFIQWLNKRYQNKLRRLKEKRQLTPLKDSVRPAKKTLSKKDVQRPTSQAPPEECLDFYLETFEKEYQKLAQQNKTQERPSSTSRKNKKPKIPKSKETSIISETDRWLHAFENKLKKPDESSSEENL